MQRRIGLLGAGIDDVTLDEAVDHIAAFLHARGAHQVVTVNLDFLRLARENAAFGAIINQSALVVADGMPLVWASRWLGQPLPERVTGGDLFSRACALAAQQGYRIFLRGGESGVPEATADLIAAQYPGAQVVGAYSPPMGPFSAEEDRHIVQMIQAAQPDILFVAFGAPKADTWIATHQDVLQVPVAIGVGGVFNFATGRVRRAPHWMQRCGAEWLFRLIQEPSRLWRRYFLYDMPILALLAAAALHSRLNSAPAAAPVRGGSAALEPAGTLARLEPPAGIPRHSPAAILRRPAA